MCSPIRLTRPAKGTGGQRGRAAADPQAAHGSPASMGDENLNPNHRRLLARWQGAYGVLAARSRLSTWRAGKGIGGGAKPLLKGRLDCLIPPPGRLCGCGGGCTHAGAEQQCVSSPRQDAKLLVDNWAAGGGGGRCYPDVASVCRPGGACASAHRHMVTPWCRVLRANPSRSLSPSP